MLFYSIQDTIKIPYPIAHFGPAPLNVRLLSYRLRPGMEWAQPTFFSSIFQSARRAGRISDTNLTADAQSSILRKSSDSAFELGWKLSNSGLANNSPPDPSSYTAPQVAKDSTVKDLSPYLLFHIHGGGFVALNSQAQDIFLRTWAEFLDCPIFSVNYSLAPQAPYPRALEECFFAYCWAALNREKLGCAPDARIVLCGDSAGGNLVLGLCMRIISARISPRPAGALVAYAPTLISFCPTPARMLSLADPLLPIGILSKCLMAYAGVDENRFSSTNSKTSIGSGRLSPQNQRRRHSVLSGTLWNRFVPASWQVTDVNEMVSANQNEALSSPSLFTARRDSVSVPTGLSELKYSSQNSVHKSLRRASSSAFSFTQADLNVDVVLILNFAGSH
ncbi:unnamed protein product [Echinostoma caproni]|uniref:Abhydrolase_3 domain-containing protein n=1 Tax=Echinostoma caproni TaxID=27848 RepID=A0A183AP63_9TREM|nr:unnamed protein product [Echinostoma caproni]